MNSQKLANLVQILTALAVLIGLLLVLYELRQAKALTFAELTSQGYSEVLENARVLMGENPAAVIARSCHSPGELSPEDIVVLEAWYVSQLAQVGRLRVLEYVADFGVPWQDIAREQLKSVLATEHGRWWFNRERWSDNELTSIGLEILSSPPDCRNALESFMARTPSD